MLRKISPPTVHVPAGQYSHSCAVPAGARVLHVAGQAGITSEGQLQVGIEGQMKQAWANLIAVLDAHGMTADDLVHVNYFLTSPDHIPALRAVREGYLPNPPPSSTTLIVSALVHPDWLYEMDAVAARVE